jgi:hypothetical protein
MGSYKKRCRRGYLGKGGASLPAPSPSLYSSGHQYGSVVSGSPQSQYTRTFVKGPTGGMGQSNALVGVQGQQSVRPPQKAGSRRKTGGVWGSVLSQAATPFGILALQQMYGRKGKSNTKKYYKRNSRRRSYRKY